MTDSIDQTVTVTNVIERRGRAMGTNFHLLTVDAPEGIIDDLERRLHQLESRWSRFIDSSEVSIVNASPDTFHLVSDDTAELVQRSVQAWSLTDGAFDPTVLDALITTGYDRTFDECGDAELTVESSASPGCGTIEIDRNLRLVRLGDGVHFDPGGMGKGLAADLLVAEALAAGARGVLVNVGGDLVCSGTAPTENGWVVDVTEATVSDDRIALLGLAGGAVATSTTAKRQWQTGDGVRHHLIDPKTGQNTAGPVLVTVVAAAGWYAEAMATQVMVTGDPSVIDHEVAAAIVVDSDGLVTTIGEMDRYLR